MDRDGERIRERCAIGTKQGMSFDHQVIVDLFIDCILFQSFSS